MPEKHNPWHNSTVSSLEEFDFRIQEFTKREGRWLFRGQSVFDEPLPRFFRMKPLREGLEETETTQLQRFRKEMLGYSVEGFASDWSVLALIQHFRGYTRLLDWTYSPLVALWFAVDGRIKEIRKACEGRAVVWLVNPIEGINSGWPNEQPKEMKGIKFFEPERIDTRFITQASVLSAHPIPKSKISLTMAFAKEWATLTRAGRLIQVQVPDTALRKVRKSLASRGVSTSSIYPKLESIAESFKEEFESLPALQTCPYANSVKLVWRNS